VTKRGHDVMSGAAGIREQPPQRLAQAARLTVERQAGGGDRISHENSRQSGRVSGHISVIIE
jgi:hypothetical protein